MSHLELLYANDWLSDEDFKKLEEVYAQKYQIPENSIFRKKQGNGFKWWLNDEISFNLSFTIFAIYIMFYNESHEKDFALLLDNPACCRIFPDYIGDWNILFCLLY